MFVCLLLYENIPGMVRATRTKARGSSQRKWNLSESLVDYLHSSAKYYAGELGNYEIDMIEE